MTLACAGDFVAAVQQFQLLDAAQVNELTQAAGGQDDARALARYALECNWLTAFQVNHLFHGRGRELLLGSYVVLERIGEGGAGQVFKARHLRMNRIVAVKVIRPDLLTDEEVVQRFYREVRVLSQLTHPNVVHAYDAGPLGATHFLVMEYVAGTDLQTLIKQQGPLPAAQACDYLWQATLGLHHAALRGLVHRDVKPANLLVTQTAEGAGPWGLVKLLDLGLARVPRQRTDDSLASVTQVGKGMMGTPDYMAPEQALDFHGADVRADLYSLGCTAYYLLTGQPPFAGGTLAQKLMKHQQAPPPTLADRSDLPPDLLAVLRRLTAKAPEDRFQTPAELAAALAPLAGRDADIPLDGTLGRTLIQSQMVTTVLANASPPILPPVLVPTESTPPSYRDAKKQRTHGRLLATGAGVVMLLGLGIVFAALLRMQAAPPPTTGAEELALSPVDVAYKELFHRFRKVLDGAEPAESLRRDLIVFRRNYAGTEESVRAGVLLSQLPSPLDKLDATAVPADQRFPWQPAEALVGVVGEHRGRAWEPLGAVAWSPDGRTIAVGSRSGSDSERSAPIRLFDAATLRERAVLRGHGGFVFWLAWSADSKTLASSATDYHGQLWSVAGKEPSPLAGLRCVAAYVGCVALSPDGKRAATANATPEVRLWDLKGKEATLRTELAGHGNWVSCAAFSADSKILATANGPNVRLWDVTVEPVAELKPLDGHEYVNSLCFSPDGARLIVGSAEGAIHVWELGDGVWKRVARLPVGDRSEKVVLSRDGRWLAAAPIWAGPVRLWRADAQGTFVRQPDLPTWNSAEWLTPEFAPDGKTLATTSRDGTLRLWDLPDEGPVKPKPLPFEPLGPHGAAVGLALFDADRALAVGTEGVSRVELAELDGPTPRPGAPLPLAKTTGRLLVPTEGGFASSWENQLALWKADNGGVERSCLLGGIDEQPVGLTSSADGRTLACLTQKGTLSCWKLTAGGPAPRGEVRGLVEVVGMPVLAPDGSLIAAVVNSGPRDRPVVRLWSVGADGMKEQQPLTDFEQAPTALAFSPDGKRLAVAEGWTGRVALWDWRGEKPRAQYLPGLADACYHSLAFTPDGKTLAAGGEGAESVVCWTLATGKRRAWIFPGPVRTVAFAADSRHILTANGNGTAYILRLATLAVVRKQNPSPGN